MTTIKLSRPGQRGNTSYSTLRGKKNCIFRQFTLPLEYLSEAFQHSLKYLPPLFLDVPPPDQTINRWDGYSRQ